MMRSFGARTLKQAFIPRGTTTLSTTAAVATMIMTRQMMATSTGPLLQQRRSAPPPTSSSSSTGSGMMSSTGSRLVADIASHLQQPTDHLPPSPSGNGGGGGSGGGAAAATPSGGDGDQSSSSASSSASWASLVRMEPSPAIEGVYVLTLCNPPVNTLTLDVMQGLLARLHQLATTFDESDGDGSQKIKMKQNPYDIYTSRNKNSSDDSCKSDLPHRCRGIILTSSVLNVFSAGLDLDQLLTLGGHAATSTATSTSTTTTNDSTSSSSGDLPYYAPFVAYWGTFQLLWHTLMGFPAPVFAAISGDCPAAGCILALCCDYRVMAVEQQLQQEELQLEEQLTPASTSAADGKEEKSNDESSSSSSTTAIVSNNNNKKNNRGGARQYRIGIASVVAGFAVPPFVAESLRYVVGSRAAERLLCTGTLLHADAALAAGLVDAVSPTDATVLLDTLHHMEQWLVSAPMEHTRWLVKENMRRPLLDILETKERRVRDLADFVRMVSQPSVQATLQAYRASLRSGSAASSRKSQKE